MATQSSILAWRTPWTEDFGWIQSIGSQRVRHDKQPILWSVLFSLSTSTPQPCLPELILLGLWKLPLSYLLICIMSGWWSSHGEKNSRHKWHEPSLLSELWVIKLLIREPLSHHTLNQTMSESVSCMVEKQNVDTGLRRILNQQGPQSPFRPTSSFCGLGNEGSREVQ